LHPIDFTAQIVYLCDNTAKSVNIPGIAGKH
jgi:hypothetical protein